MSLRCKKGDLAIVIKSNSGLEGKIVQIIDFVGLGENQTGVFHNLWLVMVDDRKTDPTNGLSYGFPDHWLLPIRPGDLKETEETEKEVESV